MTAELPIWLRRALAQIYPTSPPSSSDNSNGIANAFLLDGGAITVNGIANAFISDDGKITVNGNLWTTEEYIRRGTVSPSTSQTLRIRDFMLARPTTPSDDSTGEVAASYEVIRQFKANPNKQSRIFAHILVRIDKDPNVNVQPGEEDDGRRIMTIDEERWEGTLYRSQPQPAPSGTGN